MNTRWKKINKTIFLIALALIVFRSGNFSISFIPKPFEMLFAVTFISSVAYILIAKKIRTFFNSIPKNILISSTILVLSIGVGWAFAVNVRHIPSTFNMVLEFGTFIIGLVSMLLLLFYTKDDEKYAKWCHYALLVPGLYAVFVIIPHLTPSFLLASDGNFLGFTTNVNIISKMLLVPALFFITATIYESKDRWLQFLYGVGSALLVGLLFWISSRGALVSLACGMLCLWGVFLQHHRSFKRAAMEAGILVAIVLVGFALTPHARQQVVVNRLLNSDANQSTYAQLENKTLSQIFSQALHHKKPQTIAVPSAGEGITISTTESRLEIWPYYLRIIMRNPLGIGPDTHYQSHFYDKNGDVLSSGTHNTYLEIWLWGGILGLVCFLALLFLAFKNLRHRLAERYDMTALAILASLFALCVAITFDDSLSLFYFWIVLGLALAG